MKAVVIDQYFPDINRDSGSIDTINYVNSLNELGYEVYLSALTPEIASENKLNNLSYKEFNVIPTNDLAKWLINNSEEISVIIIFRYTTGTIVIDLIENFCSNAKKILFTSDLHFLREERALELGKNNNIDIFKIRKAEIDLMYRFDCTIVVSSFEKDIIQSIDDKINIVHIPIQRVFIGTQKSWCDRSKKVGFIGGYNHTPNIDAVENIINNILPRLRKLDPSIQIVLAGSNMPSSLKNLNIEGLEQVGFVEDLSLFFDQLKCSIAPLRFGAGQKGKVLSSLAHGLPVITSSIGAEGIASETNEIGIIIENDHQKFAEAIFEICNSEKLFDKYSKNALSYSNNSNIDSTKLALNKILSIDNFQKKSLKEKSEKIVLTVLLLTRSLAYANMNVVNSWRQQVINNPNSELLILTGDSSSADSSVALCNKVVLYQNTDYFQRVKWGIENAKGYFIQLASDDDLIQIEKVENLTKCIYDSSDNSSLINDFYVYGDFGSKIYTQNFQYYSGVDRYIKFCESMGAIPAFYSCFPKNVLSRWISFLNSNKINQPYSDWLLLLSAFLHSDYKYGGKQMPADMYNINNWNSHFKSEKSIINFLLTNKYDVKLLPILDLLWMYHSFMLIHDADIKIDEKRNGLLFFIWNFFTSRFFASISSRSLMAKLSQEEINFINYFSEKIKLEKLNFKFIYECLVGFSGVLDQGTSIKIINSIKLP